MGDTVEVKLVEAAPVTGGLRFELAEAATPAAADRPASQAVDKKTRFKPKKR